MRTLSFLCYYILSLPIQIHNLRNPQTHFGGCRDSMTTSLSSPQPDEGVAFGCRKLSDLSDEINTVAVDWKPLYGTAVCQCATSLDQIVEKVKNDNHAT